MGSFNEMASSLDDARAREPGILPADRICLFLDFDGTLIDFSDDPATLRPDPRLRELLEMVCASVDGAIALISGRRVEELDMVLRPLRLPAAGLHGIERRDAQGQQRMELPHAARSQLDAVRTRVGTLLRSHAGVLLEDKGSTLALHYRRVPHLHDLLRKELAVLAAGLGPEFELLEGDKVLEIKPHALDKATAVESFMREAPFAGRLPVFVGDDHTDRDGFDAVKRHGGTTIAVGDRVAAEWRLSNPLAVRGWLARLAEVARR